MEGLLNLHTLERSMCMYIFSAALLPALLDATDPFGAWAGRGNAAQPDEGIAPVLGEGERFGLHAAVLTDGDYTYRVSATL